MTEQEIRGLMNQYLDDSKKVSKEAETKLLNEIREILLAINSIRNMFGRNYDPNYPKLSKHQFDESCFLIALLSMSAEISEIDDNYVYIYYIPGRKMVKERTRFPVDTLMYFSNSTNMQIYKSGVINAERTHLLNDMEFKEKAYQESKLKFNKFCEKYCINN